MTGLGPGHQTLLHAGHKAVAPTTYGFNATLPLSAVTNGLTGFHNPVVQRGLTDEALWPDMLQEFLPGNHTIPMLDEIEENIEDLRLKGARCPRVTKFVKLGMQGVVIEKVRHSHLSAVQKYLSDLFRLAMILSNSCAKPMTKRTSST